MNDIERVTGPGYELWRGDCLRVLPLLNLGRNIAIVTDPPYGMDLDTDFSGFNGWAGKGHKYEKIIGDNAPFDPTPFLGIGTVQIFWGAQYFCHKLPERGGWLVFNKRGAGLPSEICFGDCELAWCNIGQSVRMYSQTWHGVPRWSTEGRLHPTQKPIGLFRWCLERYTQPGDLVLDPFLGSGTTGVAAIQTGRRFVGVEIDHTYFEVARKRIEDAARAAAGQPKQLSGHAADYDALPMFAGLEVAQ